MQSIQIVRYCALASAVTQVAYDHLNWNIIPY